MDDKDDDFDQWLPGGIVDRSASESSNSSSRNTVKIANCNSDLTKQKESIWLEYALILQHYNLVNFGLG